MAARIPGHAISALPTAVPAGPIALPGADIGPWGPAWPGTGRSGHVGLDRLDGATVVEGLGALVRLLTRSLGPPLVLLTHSMSGAYGWRLLELHGDVIAAVVGVAPAPPGNIQKLPPVYEETETIIETQASGRGVRIAK